MAIPSVSITDPKFIYQNSVTTDIRNLWRKHGWAPPQRIKSRVRKVDILQGGQLIATVDRLDDHATLVDVKTRNGIDWFQLQREVQNVFRPG
jgi:hypothetical protein